MQAHRCVALRTERRTARASLASGNAAAAADRFLPIPLPRLGSTLPQSGALCESPVFACSEASARDRQELWELHR